MSSSATERIKIINPVQLAAGAGASVTAAVAGSFLGIAGTLVGAAVASVVSSMAVALYGHAISQAGLRLRRREDGTIDAEEVPVVKPPLLDRIKVLGWKKLLIPAVLLFAIVLVVLTSTEALAGKPVSAMVTGTKANGTTLTQVSRGNVGAPKPVTPVVGETSTPVQTASPSESVPPTPAETSVPTETSTELPTGVSTQTPTETNTGQTSLSESPTGTATSSPSTTVSSTTTPSPTSTPTGQGVRATASSTHQVEK